MPSPEQSTHSPNQKVWVIVAGMAILAAGFGLRAWQLRESLWLDELHTAWCVGSDWGDVGPRAGIGNQSPLYFYLLRAWIGVAGADEVTLRLPSLLAGLALIAVAGLVVTRWTESPTAGLFAAALIAVDRNAIFYSQEARPYALLQLVAWCHAFLVWRLAQSPTLTLRCLFVGGVAVQFYLHYTSMLFVLAELIYLIDQIVRRDDRSQYGWRQLAFDLLGIVAVILPAAPHLMEIGARRELWEQFVGMPSVRDYWHLLRLEAYLLPTATLSVVARFSKVLPATATSTPSSRSATSLTACLLFVPTILAWVATRRQVAAIFLGRYLVSSLVAAPIAAAVAAQRLVSPRLRCVAMASTLAASIWISGMWPQWQVDGRFLGDRRQDWRGAVEFLNRNGAPDKDVCYVRSGLIEATRLDANATPAFTEYCLFPVRSLYPLKMSAVPLSSSAKILIQPTWLSQESPGSHWFLINGSLATRQRIQNEIASRCRELGLPEAFARSETFGDLLVLELARR